MSYNQLKKMAIVCLKFILTVLIVWYLFNSGRLTEDILMKIFTIKNLPLFVLCGITFLISQLIAASRLNYLLKIIDRSLTLSYIFKLTMVGNFFNIVIPGALGGDVIKGIYLFKNESDRQGRSMGILLMDRIIGLLALCMIGILSIFYLYERQKYDLIYYREVTVFVVIFGLALLLILLLLFILGDKPNIRMKARSLISMVFKNTIFYHMFDAVGAIAKERRVFAYTFVMSIALQLTTICGLMLLVNLEKSSSHNLITLAAVSSVVMLLSIVPVTPGNIGWTELIASIGWATVGSASGAAVFFYWRVVLILFSLPGAILYLSLRRRVIPMTDSIYGN
jgi:uncharacterized protein (TIRG00374 family)